MDTSLQQFICDVCYEEFSIKIHYLVHSFVHLLKDNLNCHVCQKGITCILNLKKHLKIHEDPLCVSSHVCEKELFDIDSLKEYGEEHNNESTNLQQNMQSEYTPRKAHNNENSSSVEHSLRDNLQNVFRCERSKKTFSEKHNLDKHQNDCIKKTVNSNKYKGLVSMSFTSVDNLPESNEKQCTINKFCDNEKCSLDIRSPRNKLQNVFSYVNCIQEFPENSHFDDEHCQMHYMENNLNSNDWEDESNPVENLIVLDNEPLASDALEVIENVSSSKKTDLFNYSKTFIVEVEEKKNNKTNSHYEDLQKTSEFVCETCQKAFINNEALTNHLSTHEVEKIFVCYYCEKKFTLKSLFDAHLQTHKIEKFFCGVCQKGFTEKRNLFSHIYTHARVKSFSCNICQMTFSEKSLLEKHSLNHTDGKKYTCNICQKTLSSRSGFYIHQRAHSGFRPFVCEICSKRFTILANLRRHFIIHTGKKPFKCETCGASFNQKSILTKHSLIHQQQSCDLCPEGVMVKSCGASRLCVHLKKKSFKCDECDKSFSTNHSLKRHQHAHAGNKSYICEICKKCFHQKSQLRVHHRSHLGEKPSVCGTCGKIFTAKTNATSCK